MEKNNINPKKIRWKCRRGMLELDLIVGKFFEQYFETLSPHQQLAFDELLEMPDPVIQSWLLQQEIPVENNLLEIIGLIKSTMQHK